jgi:LysM repeat protein
VALFLVAVWGALAEPLSKSSQAPADAAAGKTSASAPTAAPSVATTATQVPSPTRGVVVVERGPPTATPRPSPTQTVPPTPTPSPTVTPTATISPTQTVSPTATTTTTPTEAPTPSPTPTIYTVQQGDTLTSIGQRFGVPWQAIAAANGLPENAILQLGQQLVIPLPAP